MPCIEWKRPCAAVFVATLAACSAPPAQPPQATATAPRAPAPPIVSAAASPVPPAAQAPLRSWIEVRALAAQRMVAANRDGTYTGTVPDILLAIPVLEVELNADGSIRRIEVLRRPGQAPETLQMAIDAMQRAAPFGDVSRLPKPWKFSETFLFREDRKFKPRTLDP